MILNQILPAVLKQIVWRSVWRICMWILKLKGLKQQPEIRPNFSSFHTFSLLFTKENENRVWSQVIIASTLGNNLILIMEKVGMLSGLSLRAGGWEFPPANRELKQQWRQLQREQQKSNRFKLRKRWLCTCITLFCTFLCSHYNVKMPYFMICRGWEHSSFPELWYSPLEFNFKKTNFCRHQTN